MERGQTAVNLVLDHAGLAGLDPDQAQEGSVGAGGVSIASVKDLAAALQGIDLTSNPVLATTGTTAMPFAALLAALAQQQGTSLANLQGWVQMDPLGVLAQDGSLAHSLEQAYDEMAQMTAWAEQEAPALQTIAVQSYPYHNSGGNAIQELAFVLATGVEYLRALQERGLSSESAAPRMGFGFAVGTHFFMEIAKLRAARLLWAQVVEAFGGSPEAQKMRLHMRTSTWNKTVYDPYVNMLRTTVEAFAGSMGGGNSMHVAPFDEILRQPDEFSRRIARNTQLILQQECNFNRLIDPAGGSWYIESLTDQLARAAWGLFQEVEKQGGMLKALQAGFPQSQVAEIAKKRADALASRKDVLLGTNMYPNLFEKNLDPRTPDFAALRKERAAQVTHEAAAQEKLSAMGQASGAARMQAAIAAAQAGATLGEITGALRGAGAAAPSIEPLRLHRGSEPFEALRKASEAYRDQHGKRPQVFLANMGPLVQHKARADFTTGFLEVGGFEMIRPEGFETPEAAAQAAIDSGAQVVVICSTDDTYPDLVPPLTQQIKAASADITVLVAGYPADQVETHKAAGVDDFIHLRANCYEMNAKLQQKIGVSA
jgi:methylmalonyl-CoA mutase